MFPLDCQTFFLRHAESGKCIIGSEKLVYKNNNAFPYYVEMTDNCLNISAQFRYHNPELIRNSNGATLLVLGSANYSKYLAVYVARTNEGRSIASRDVHYLKQTDAGSLFYYNRDPIACAEPGENYVLRKNYCNTTKQEFTFGK